MSYVARTPRLSYKILWWIAVPIALLFGLAILMSILFWWQDRPVDYVLIATSPIIQVANEGESLRARNNGAPCETIGREIEYRGRPALGFSVPPYDEGGLECLQDTAPRGYRLQKED